LLNVTLHILDENGVELKNETLNVSLVQSASRLTNMDSLKKLMQARTLPTTIAMMMGLILSAKILQIHEGT